MFGDFSVRMKLEKKETKSIKKNENKIVDEFQEVKVQLT